MRIAISALGALLVSAAGRAAVTPAADKPSDVYIRELNDLDTLWSLYKYCYMADGRVISPENGGLTTSEGQGYALLRSVWSNDRATFDTTWRWTRTHLQTRPDRLFSWKWNGHVLDPHSATDADTDIALALILASRRFDRPDYKQEALAILNDIWAKEVVTVGRDPFVTSGDWAATQQRPLIHVAYLAPYAYQEFASVDQARPWQRLVKTSYRLLDWIYFKENLPLPPEIVYLDRATGSFIRSPSSFSYDAFPIFWRVALDRRWNHRMEGRLRRAMLNFFAAEWKNNGRLLDAYSIDGAPLSNQEGLALYASVHSLALVEDRPLADQIRAEKLAPLWESAFKDRTTPYYLQNWLWFDRAFDLSATTTGEEWFAFMRPFDSEGFARQFPWILAGIALALFPFARFHASVRAVTAAICLVLCGRYLGWRLLHSLNLTDPAAAVMSIALWIAEAYAFTTLALLLVQVGLRKARPVPPTKRESFNPSVAIFIPTFQEPAEILEKTLIGATAIAYPNKTVYVLDDGRRPAIRALAEAHGAIYFEGPQQKSKAVNLNSALAKTASDLVAIFDTDHIPVASFLNETVPYFSEPNVGFVQVPHHFYNEDIFQRAFGNRLRVPNEQDMFHHAMQSQRSLWNGAFFVGSGAVFRRGALDGIGGFRTLSITEDIHTSQYLHAAGWKSVFVDKNLMAGLAAENLSAYIVQRRRWMLGTLQILFRDNPLFCRGLTVRQRMGYFASLYYFLFPAARFLLWIAPLTFLLFHVHPIRADLPALFAYLIPFLVAGPLMTSMLLEGWPRVLWADVYEAAIAAPLFSSLLALLRPKTLTFKVTPKGLRSDRRTFDWRSSWETLIALAITVVAMTKGIFEYFYFGVEREAYFFNLFWASFSLVLLGAALLVIWEKPQKRHEARIKRELPFQLHHQDFFLDGRTADLSITGFSFVTDRDGKMPDTARVLLHGAVDIVAQAKLVHHEPVKDGFHCAYEFIGISHDATAQLIRELYTAPDAWPGSNKTRARNNTAMLFQFLKGLAVYLRPARERRRKAPRASAFAIRRVGANGHRTLVMVTDRSARGLGFVTFGRRVKDPASLGLGPSRTVFSKRVAPFVWRVGLEQLPEPAAASARGSVN